MTPMTPHRSLRPAGWLRPLGYSNGVEARGRHIFLAGQVGWNEHAVIESRDLVGQVRQALTNVATLLAEAGAGPEHITRMTWYVVDKQDYLRRLPEIGLVYHEVIGRQFPPFTAVHVLSLMEEHALVEIEVTAVAVEH
jgi:enamine deaminase RidA (YjgF/YER057c/UK114 family)